MPNKGIDPALVIGYMLVFGLPMTILLPDFSLWDIIPKVHVERLHIVELELTWTQTNTVIITLLSFFFCIFLEVRKRKLDDIVEKVLTVCHGADTTLKGENGRQEAAFRVCIDLLGASTEHYENLALLRDELRKRDNLQKQFPPGIEYSSSNF